MEKFIVIEDIKGDFIFTRPEQVQTIRTEKRTVPYMEGTRHLAEERVVTILRGPRLDCTTYWTPQEVIALVEGEEVKC